MGTRIHFGSCGTPLSLEQWLRNINLLLRYYGIHGIVNLPKRFPWTKWYEAKMRACDAVHWAMQECGLEAETPATDFDRTA